MKLETILKIMNFKKWDGEKHKSPPEAKEIIMYTYKKEDKYIIEYYVR